VGLGKLKRKVKSWRGMSVDEHIDLGRGRYLRRRPCCLRESGSCELMKKDIFRGCSSIRCRHQFFEIVITRGGNEESQPEEINEKAKAV